MVRGKDRLQWSQGDKTDHDGSGFLLALFRDYHGDAMPLPDTPIGPVHCPDCQSTRTIKVLDLRKSMLYSCRDCGHSFEVPRIPDAAVK